MQETVLRALSWLIDRRLARRIAAMQHSNGVVRAVWSTISRPLRWRTVRIFSGPGKGLRINLNGSAVAFATGTAERPLQEALVRELSPGATFYDIGANIGFVTIIAARLVGPTGRVVAFEPVPENVAAIKRNLALNGIDWVDVRPVAVSARAGRASLVLSEVSAFSRLSTMHTPTGARGTLEVDVDSIDELLARDARTPPPDVVKIDVEGAELDVIEGMRETLAARRPVLLCEVHDCNVAYVELMARVGYAPINLDEDVPVERGNRNAHTLARPLPSAA